MKGGIRMKQSRTANIKINYWLNFFPELTEKNEIVELLEKTSQINVDKILKKERTGLQKNPIFLMNQKQTDSAYYLSNSDNNDLFPEAFCPIVNYYFKPFIQFIKENPTVVGKDAMLSKLLSSLMSKLSGVANRTLIKDLKEQQSKLIGDSEEEKFQYYRKYFLGDNMYLIDFYQRYEGLFTLIDQSVKNYFTFIKEVIHHTEKYQTELEKIFNHGEDIGQIEHFHIDLGDSHSGSKTVLAIEFSTGKWLVYKPRSLDLEQGFNTFLHWLNQQKTGLLPFKEMKVFSQKDFGWMSYAEHTSCQKQEDVHHFYRNIGQLTALLYTLNGKDFHHENIIAAGKYPVLVDLESLFHTGDRHPIEKNSKAYEKIYHILNNSVHSIGILPQLLKSQSTEDFISADIGGISGAVEQKSPFKSHMIKNRNRADIYIDQEYGTINIQKNNPILNGVYQNSLDYSVEIEQGFNEMYQWILHHKLTLGNRIKTIFSSATSRYIARPTFMYGQLLRTSYHPQILQSTADRLVLLHRLGVNHEHYLTPLLASEIADMEQGDIPYFKVQIGKCGISDTKKELTSTYFSKSPLDEVLEKLARLDEKDHSLQLFLIQQTFQAKKIDARKDITNIQFSKTIKKENYQAKKWLHLAEQIGDSLLARSIRVTRAGKGYLTWVGTMFEGENDEYWEMDTVGNDLYLGNSGIALFLGYLGALSGEEKYTKAAEQALNLVMEEVTLLVENSGYLSGAFNGMSGSFYAIGQLSRVMNQTVYHQFIKKYLSLLNDLIATDKNHDVISGNAGNLLVLLSLYELFDDEEIKEQIKQIGLRCYEHLKNHRIDLEQTMIHWRRHQDDPLVGFAHGNSGIVASLIKLYDITKKEDILSVIKKALSFERKYFSRQKKGWFYSKNSDDIASGWCNGTSGILLSRMMLQHYGYHDQLLEQEIQLSLQQTLTGGFGHNASLCHGDLGNLEIVSLVSRYKKDTALKQRCLNTFHHLYEEVLNKNWTQGVFRGTESFNMMIGLSGYGYSLLQAYTEYGLPSLMSLN